MRLNNQNDMGLRISLPSRRTKRVGDARWLALIILCAGFLMIVLDQTIVNVALPSIKNDLGFSQAGLAWVVNAYLIAYGDRKSTRLNSSHLVISYAVFCLKKKKKK